MIICHNSDLIVKWNHKHIEEDQKNTSFPEAWLSIVKYEQLVFNAITGVEFCVLSLSPYCTQLSYIFCAFFKLFRDHLMYTSLRVDRLISTKLHCQLTRLPPRPPKYFEHSLDAFRKLSCKYSCLLPKRSGKSQPMSRVKNFQPKNLEPQHPTPRVQSYNSLVLRIWVCKPVHKTLAPKGPILPIPVELFLTCAQLLGEAKEPQVPNWQ